LIYCRILIIKIKRVTKYTYPDDERREYWLRLEEQLNIERRDGPALMDSKHLSGNNPFNH
jgi:hypothetical protein